LARIWALAALAVGVWLLSAYGQSRPDPLPLNATAASFSAARADVVLGRVLADQRPHPAGSAAAEALRGRILTELAALGVAASTRTGMSCYAPPRWRYLSCGTVTNIIAELSPGQKDNTAKAILLMAHSDSVAAGPGAADDGSGVAILLETIRALKARSAAATHPVIALFTDGEEAGLLGAAFYLRDARARARIGAVINVEARGNQGPSYLFQTSAGNSKLIDLYAGSVTHYATSSLYGEIYKRLPNDTDLTPMLELGVPAYNFAFLGNFAQYHTPLDRRENIDPRSLQQQGENVVEVADALRRADLAGLAGTDSVYLDVLGVWLPRLAVGWMLPLSVAVFAVIALAGYWTRRERRTLSNLLLAAVTPPLLLAGCVGLGYYLHALAAWISGQADPSFAYPVILRLAMAFGVFAVALVAAQGASAIAIWLWFAALAIACAVLAPGVTPYFLFPACVAAVALPATIRGGRGIALWLSALAALVVWMGLNQGSEAIMGLKLHPLFTVSAAFALLPLLPLLKKTPAWRMSAAVLLGLGMVLSVAAGLAPAYSARAPQQLNLRYTENNGKAYWLADPVTRLPDGLRAAANFSAGLLRMPGLGRAYVAAAGPAHLAVPRADIQRDGNDVALHMDAPGDGFTLLVPAGLTKVNVAGVVVPATDGPAAISCLTPDCAHAQLTLSVGERKMPPLLLLAYRRGLPAAGAKLAAARLPNAVAVQDGDQSVVAMRIALPER
jgi:hypothetical protein